MASKHPYTSSGSGAVVQTITHLKKSFPVTVTADTLKKLGIAPNNETYIIGILRFIGVLDDGGNKTSKATSVFTKHNAEDFQKGLSDLVESAYKDLFALHGKDAWDLSTDQLISFFRGADHTSDLVGKRQAQTFRALAALSGHGEPPKPIVTKPAGGRKATKGDPAKLKKSAPTPVVKTDMPATSNGNGSGSGVDRGDVGLTVRIEINLPASGDQETYDRIFKSIRENLLRG
ncbi:MAG: hypothetical protein GEV06_09440 [Luteitalea sp.]|nr:hypothetical protein [Luteitalea sp.]